jgi:beta-phosphoglucomutase family hydrolase
MRNDVPMFGVAGTSIAMGNADPDVQRKAQYVTTSNEEEGFANAVDQFVPGDIRESRSALGLPEGVRACLFDLDGVLTQTAKLHAAAWKQVFDEFLQEHARQKHRPFVPFDAGRDYAKYVDGKLRLDGARSFLVSREIHLPEEEVLDLAHRKDKKLLEILSHERVETYEGSVRYVHAVREAGLRTAVVSSSKHCREVLSSAGISNLFDVLVDGNTASEMHLAGKPAPDTFLAAARALGMDPTRAAVFEDAISGVEAGRAGHFGYVIGVDRLGQEAELRRHGANRVVRDLASLFREKSVGEKPE